MRSINPAPSHATYLVDQNSVSWNPLTGWLRHLDQLRLERDRTKTREAIGRTRALWKST